MTKMRRFGPEDKPKKSGEPLAKSNEGRYAWHACWHDDAWRGIEFMAPEIVGVYWRIILLMYRQRSALRDDDEKMAMACFTSLKTYRRAKQALIEADRIGVDEENGVVFCKRAIKQLVKDDRFRETQGKRGKFGGRPRLAVDNVMPLPIRDEGEMEGDFVGDLGGVFSGDKVAPPVENKGKQKTPGKATHTQIQKESFLAPKARPPSAAQPPRGGGARAPLKQMSVAERAAEIERFRAALEAEQEGNDGGSDGGSGATIGARKAARKKRLPGVGN